MHPTFLYVSVGLSCCEGSSDPFLMVDTHTYTHTHIYIILFIIIFFFYLTTVTFMNIVK